MLYFLEIFKKTNSKIKSKKYNTAAARRRAAYRLRYDWSWLLLAVGATVVLIHFVRLISSPSIRVRREGKKRNSGRAQDQ
jgi:hypothetical protein